MFFRRNVFMRGPVRIKSKLIAPEPPKPAAPRKLRIVPKPQTPPKPKQLPGPSLLAQLARRGGVISGAYILAALAAGLVISAYGVLALGGPYDLIALGKGAALSFFYAGMVLVMAALPAFLWFAFSEHLGLRELWLHVMVGLVLGAGLELFADKGNVFELPAFVTFALAGLVAGLVYWAVAGRKAGLPPASRL